MKLTLTAIVLNLIFIQALHSQQVVYPLHVADLWEYWTAGVGGTYDYTKRVTKDTLLSNGISYAFVEGEMYFSKPFQRQVGDSVFQYIPSLGKEKLLYDFSRSPGDTIAQYPRYGDTTTITLVSMQTVTIFGTKLRQWKFLVDHLKHSIDDEEYDYVTDSLGLTYVGCFCYEWTLHGAYIYGVQYGMITEVAEMKSDMPSVAFLEQNYPDPFNSSTKITFSISIVSMVQLKIYNILGREIITLVNQKLAPGQYDVEFDGMLYSSGVYFMILHSERSPPQTRKMLLLR